jgi:hypothetical protein
MIKFRNLTTRERFDQKVDLEGLSIRPLGTVVWDITNKYGCKWRVRFLGEVGDFAVSGPGRGRYDNVYLYLSGDKVELYKVIDTRGCTLKSDRFLKKYREVATLVSSYFMFGYIK